MKGAHHAFFGSDAQQALLRRGADLHAVTRDQEHLIYYGRTVGIAAKTDAPIDLVFALARLQGHSNFADVPDPDVPDLRAAITREGFFPQHYARLEGGRATLDCARAMTSDMKLPTGYRLEWLTPDTGASLREALAKTCLACSVLPPSLAVLSGDLQPGVCVMAVDGTGAVAGCAAGASYLHPQHPDGRTMCWWGMLAVDPKHRGQALSLFLGAQAIIEMNRRYGFSRFMTGVEPGNAPSEAICAKMGLVHDGRSILGVADPSRIPGGRMTK